MSVPIAPPLPVNAIISIQPLTTAIPSTGTQLPAQFTALPVGTNVQGFVINRDSHSNPILRTSLGDVLVQSDMFIRTGSEVVFRIDATQAGRARIISIDGLVPEDYVSQSGQGIAEDTIALPSVATPPSSAQPGQQRSASLEALVLKPLLLPGQTQPNAQASTLPTTGSLLPQLQALQPGQPLKITVLSAQLPPPPVSLAAFGEPAPNLQNLVANQIALLSGARETANSVASLATPAAQQAPLSHTSVVPENFLLPATASPPEATQKPPIAASNAPLLAQEVSQPHPAHVPNAPYVTPYTNTATAAATQTVTAQTAPSITVNATVIGHEGDGATVLQTPFATIKLYTPQPLPHGTELKLAVSIEKSIPLTPLPFAPHSPTSTIAAITQDWQGLGDALAQLQTAQPHAWADLARVMPTADHRLASTLLFFIASVKGGDAKQWLPPRALDALELISPGMLSKLGENMGELKQLFTPQPNSNWTSVMLPIYYSGELQPAHLHLRHEEEPEEKSGGKGGGGGQRFLVEVDLSQLGSMQLDGFVRGEQREKQLDLVVRNARALPAEVTQGIRATFDSALQVTGLKGQVLFQTGVQHFIRPLAERGNTSEPTQTNTILA